RRGPRGSGERTPPTRGAHLRPRRARRPRSAGGGRARRLRPPADARAGRARAAGAREPLLVSSLAPATSPLAAAYEHCEAVTRRAHSNFYWGFRLLPHERRRSLCAVYAFCRAADDIADEPGVASDPARLLARWRA